MSSSTTNNDAFQTFIEDSQDDDEDGNRWNSTRPSLVPRQISFAQHRATAGEIILVLLPYFILIFDIFIYFLFRGFQFTSFDRSALASQK